MVAKWATWAKARRLGVTTVCARNCSRLLSLNGSVLQKVSDVLKVEERKKDDSQLEPKAGGKCGMSAAATSVSIQSRPQEGTP